MGGPSIEAEYGLSISSEKINIIDHLRRAYQRQVVAVVVVVVVVEGRQKPQVAGTRAVVAEKKQNQNV